MVVGVVGSGAEVKPHEPVPLDELLTPPNAGEIEEAYVVQGDTQIPVFYDRDTIFRGPWVEPEALVNQRECIVELVDGRKMVKTLIAGAKPGLFTLLSHNAPPLIDQDVAAAAQVRCVVRAPIDSATP